MNADFERLFEALIELPTVERSAFLAQNCADPELRRELQLLVAGDASAESFLGLAVAQAAEAVLRSTHLEVGQQLGPYRIVSLIGHGGMGAVYRAERADGQFEQQVAIKVVTPGPHPSSWAERLQNECRILATMEHPNIARLLDAGTTQDGLPYFVMEFVAGRTIAHFCDEQALPVEERLRLCLPICDAVHFAHQKLVVHRDLKPDNIVVTAQGVPKLLDFGIAKVLEDNPLHPQLTATLALTPEYASPEQFRGEAVSTATDIYSLGGVLYKLLTRLTPHRLQGKSPVQAIRVVCEEPLVKPSRVRPDLGSDLDNIVCMAMHPDPKRRYASAERLASDIRRFLDGQPVLATPDTAWYRGRKFVRRHWAGVSAIVAVWLALTLGAGLAVWQARRAQQRFEEVRNLANIFLFDFEQSIHDVPGATKARQLLVKTGLDYLQRLSRDASGDAGLTHEVATAYEKVGDIQGSPDAGNVGDVTGAVRSYERAVTLRRSLGDATQDSMGRLGLAKALSKLCAVQERTGEIEPAKKNCAEAISLLENLTPWSSNSEEASSQLGSTYGTMSYLQRRAGDVPAALQTAQRAVALQEETSRSHVQGARRTQLAAAYFNLAQINAAAHNQQEALAFYQKSLAIREQILSEDGANARARRQVMIGLATLGRSNGSSRDRRGRKPNRDWPTCAGPTQSRTPPSSPILPTPRRLATSLRFRCGSVACSKMPVTRRPRAIS